MFKINTNSPKKNSVDISAPFESLIGSEFLSLFANGKSWLNNIQIYYSLLFILNIIILYIYIIIWINKI